MHLDGLIDLLSTAIDARVAMLDEKHESAVRLFNGYLEGYGELVVDLYAQTIVLHNYGAPFWEGDGRLSAVTQLLLDKLPFITCIILKEREGKNATQKNGVLIHGDKPNHWVREHGIRYAIDLQMNQDASLYLDTRNLRQWLIDNSDGKDILNTFAYTGSLGVAAIAGGATRVIQADLNKKFLNIAKTSYTLNGYPIHKKQFQGGDFWGHMNKLKRAGERFDTIILDPPFFSVTKLGRIDITENMDRLINKVRPLINGQGQIIAINNALYMSGEQYMAVLEELCIGGYVSIETTISIPQDFTGFPNTINAEPITNPDPFNHSTKIAILNIKNE